MADARSTNEAPPRSPAALKEDPTPCGTRRRRGTLRTLPLAARTPQNRLPTAAAATTTTAAAAAAAKNSKKKRTNETKGGKKRKKEEEKNPARQHLSPHDESFQIEKKRCVKNKKK